MALLLKRKVFCFLFFLGCLLPMPPPALCSQNQEAGKYLKMLESDSIKTRTDAAKMISRSQLTDKALFDTIEKKLLLGYTHEQMNAKHMDEMAWYCKALSSSGNSDYEETLSKVAHTTTSQKLKHYCASSLELLPVNAKRRQVMKDSITQTNNLSTEENEIIAMMQSEDLKLMRDGAKLTYRHPFSNDAVYDVIKEKLLKNYASASGNRNLTDSLAWMCKALGASGKAKYKDALRQVSEETTNQKLKKYARQSLGML